MKKYNGKFVRKNLKREEMYINNIIANEKPKTLGELDNVLFNELGIDCFNEQYDEELNSMIEYIKIHNNLTAVSYHVMRLCRLCNSDDTPGTIVGGFERNIKFELDIRIRFKRVQKDVDNMWDLEIVNAQAKFHQPKNIKSEYEIIKNGVFDNSSRKDDGDVKMPMYINSYFLNYDNPEVLEDDELFIRGLKDISEQDFNLE